MRKDGVAVILATLLTLSTVFQLSYASDIVVEKCDGEIGSCENKESVFDVFGRWVDDVNEETNKFLEQHVFNQKDVDEEAREPLEEDTIAQKEGESNGLWHTLSEMVSSKDESRKSAVNEFLEQARVYATAKATKRNFQEILEVFKEGIDRASASLTHHFGHIEFKTSLPISLWYWLEKEDEKKNPSWKRKRHRFDRDLDVETAKKLHDDLYLSHLSYSPSVDDIKNLLKDYRYDLELIYAQMESFPEEPAHFIALKREGEDKSILPWGQNKYLDVVMVVRGTSSLGDVLSDVILDATEYRGGKTHQGVASAGMYLAKKHKELLNRLLEASGRETIRLLLTGHSLGAGAAAIAAIEFNDFDNVEARAIGFGCPALLTKELSESTKDYITTVIADSDVVPRMSGASVANVVLDMMSFDWTNVALEDTEQLLEAVDSNLFFDVPKSEVLSRLESYFDKHDRPFFDLVPLERQETVLVPPGECIHVFRDGIGFSGKYTPCSFFDSIDVTRTMLLDHITETGYHRALLEFVRQRLDDLHFDFRHDLLAVKV